VTTAVKVPRIGVVIDRPHLIANRVALCPRPLTLGFDVRGFRSISLLHTWTRFFWSMANIATE
jgi:hypothetical protein